MSRKVRSPFSFDRIGSTKTSKTAPFTKIVKDAAPNQEPSLGAFAGAPSFAAFAKGGSSMSSPATSRQREAATKCRERFILVHSTFSFDRIGSTRSQNPHPLQKS
jgi:hypothetical protein